MAEKIMSKIVSKGVIVQKTPLKVRFDCEETQQEALHRVMKSVLKVMFCCEKTQQEALHRVSKMEGFYYLSFDPENRELTVFGDMDPVSLFIGLKKYGAFLVSVVPSKDPSAQFSFATSLASFTSTSTATSTSNSASASTASSRYVYDVFISHRGPDTKKGFASDLYHALIKHNYLVFLDEKEMESGENLMPQIEGAIQTASVHIAVLSPRYAESKWCLEELVLMLESRLQTGSTLLPVFYGVQPLDLRLTRDQNRIYGRALSELERKTLFDSQTPRYSSEKIEKWRKTLSDVADISGFVLEACNHDEGQLTDKVVQRVLEKVRKTPVGGAIHPTGLDDKVNDFESTVSWQQRSQETRIIGIVGIGGVGKTTLAKEIFNRHLSKYKKCCFLFDVRGKPLHSLQSRLLKDLAQCDKQIDHVDFGVEEIKKRLKQISSDPVLLVLDDVDHSKQLDALLGPVKVDLHPGSLILMTSRSKDILTKWGIEESSIYKQTGLSAPHSRELFCLYAFRQCSPRIGFEQVVGKFLSVCDGLPLCLTVLGALLHGEDLDCWEAQLRQLSDIVPDDIQSRLKISYDALNVVEKHIFLDTASFFIGEHRDTGIRIWDGCGWQGRLGLRTLENRCLIELDSENRIKMHDLVREMGRYIADNEPPEGLHRLRQSNLHLFQSDQSLVRGISMFDKDGRKSSEQSFGRHAGSRLISNMSKLQLLRAEGHCVKSLFKAEKSPQLRWLCLYDCSYRYLPSWIPLLNLRVLQIKASKLNMLWLFKSQAPLQLRELNIEARLFRIPKSIGKLKHLQKFVLHSTQLKTLPDEFCLLESLQHAEICSNMKSLPHRFGDLLNLRCICLSGCSNLKMLPDSFGNLENLKDINLGWCSELKTLPNSFENLKNLERINLSRCSKLEKLPNSFGNLRNLEHINLSGCCKLETLPNSFGNLQDLKHINLSACFELRTLPHSFGNLYSLQHIDLSWCLKLEALPDIIANLKNLRHIDLEGCVGFHTLPDIFGNLPNLRRLDLSNCPNLNLEELPVSLADLKKIKNKIR